MGSLLHFPPLQSTPAFSTPAFSTPAVCSRIFHSCIFQPCNYARAAFSTPTFSVAPLLLVASICSSISSIVMRKDYTRRHNYRVTSAPPSRLSVGKQKCVQWSTEFAKLSAWPSQFRRQAVPDPEAGSGETPVAKRVRVLGTMHVSTSAERRRRRNLSEEAS